MGVHNRPLSLAAIRVQYYIHTSRPFRRVVLIGCTYTGLGCRLHVGTYMNGGRMEEQMDVRPNTTRRQAARGGAGRREMGIVQCAERMGKLGFLARLISVR